MKRILLLLTLALCTYGQARCQTPDYILKVAPCEKDSMMLTRFRIEGLPRHQVNTFRNAIRFHRGMTIEPTKSYFDKQIAAHWENKRFPLTKIEVLREDYEENPTCCHVYVHFKFTKVKK